MNYTHLGRTGLKVSRLCLGTMKVRLTDSELREIDAALAKIPLQGGRADPFTESQFDKS